MRWGIFPVGAIIFTALVERYVSNDYIPFWEKHLVLSGVVTRGHKGHEVPAVHAVVNLIFPHEGKQEYSDTEGKYTFSLTGSGRDSVDIECIVGNQISRRRIFLDYNGKGEHIDTIQFEDSVAPLLVKTGAFREKMPKMLREGDYYHATSHTDMALLTAVDATVSIFEDEVGKYFRGKGMAVSTSFFRPLFIREYSNTLKRGDPSILFSLKVNTYARYVCFIDPSVSYSQSRLGDNTFITALGSYNIVLFNLKTNNASRIVISQRGAGPDMGKAKEDLEEKCIYALQSKFDNISL